MNTFSNPSMERNKILSPSSENDNFLPPSCQTRFARQKLSVSCEKRILSEAIGTADGEELVNNTKELMRSSILLRLEGSTPEWSR